MSSKCKRLNKLTNTNHYHDSGSKQASTTTSLSIPTPTRHSDNSSKQLHHHHIHLSEPPLGEQSSLWPSSSSSSSAPMSKATMSPLEAKRRHGLPISITMTRPATKHNCKHHSKLLAFLTISASILFVLLVLRADLAQSLNCYTCSSADNPGCDEPFTAKSNITDTDCEKQIGRPAKVCRKLIQYIEHKKVVIRSCGYIDEHDEKDRKPMCYKRSGTFALMMESCICYEDNCNHSASLVPNQSVLLLLSGFSLMFVYIFKAIR